jgi:hypothetical protein
MADVRRLFPALLVAVLATFATRAHAQIGFADNQADRFLLWNADYYELGFRKADGRLLYITDKTSGAQVSPGNVHGPWVIRFSNGIWLDGENFSPSSGTRRFSYSWDPLQSTLTLTYHATGTYACDVTITIRPTNGPEVDTTLNITSQSSVQIDLLAYPVQLSFQRSQIEAVYVPYLEGMRLLPTFFETQTYVARYPGRMFADFAYTDLTSGALAIYALQDRQTAVKPVNWQILRDDAYAGGVSKYHHDYDVALNAGQPWTSPTTVLSIGATLSSAMDAYWTRSGNAGMPTLVDKLGPNLFQKLAGAVHLKRDLLQGSWTFDSFRNFMPSLPPNNLLHLVAFWPVGFDENYPDYLPPNPALGNLAQLQNLVTTARAAGHIVMPYTNPTWWDDQSPTLTALGTGIVTRNRAGGLISENYGVHGGYVISPFDPSVIARQDQTRVEFTQTVPCDLLFEDQIGARDAPTYATHPSAPDPIAYTQGLINVATRSATYLPIMTESGSDRLAWVESGYCNSQTIGWHWWAASTYTPYPMSPLWAHENLYFNAHNLAGEVMANDLPLLTYYLSMGYSLSHDLSRLDADWLRLLDCVQKHLVSHLVGVKMSAFENLPTSGRTRTTFGSGVTITANRTATAMTQDGHVVHPQGFLAQQNGDVLGGVLATLNGQALSGSAPHYLVIERVHERIAIYQPRGDDGPLTLLRPATWATDERIHISATTQSGVALPYTISLGSSTLQFDYQRMVAGQSIDHFAIVYCRAGDADCDGDVDNDDLAVFLSCMAGPGVTTPPPGTTPAQFAAADFDGDGDVDLKDFAAFQVSFGS